MTRPPGRRRIALLALIGGWLVVFLLLGQWQLERRSWKLELIARVEAQLAQPPVPAPGPAEWEALQADDAYRRVTLRGQYLHQQETLVQAMTSHGTGYWVLTPLLTQGGFTVLVNRGFVDAAHQQAAERRRGLSSGLVNITGLLRLSEPDGRLLQKNQPAQDRWYSRDVLAIGAARKLAAHTLAPYFIDADANLHAGEWPIGGLTVVHFRNAHLAYALTWFSLAALCLICGLIVLRQARR